MVVQSEVSVHPNAPSALHNANTYWVGLSAGLRNAGVSLELVGLFAERLPILGVCLGHQCIVEALGGKIERASRVMHGKVSSIYHDGRTIYAGLSNPFTATRYHSLIVLEENVPDALEVSSYTSGGEIMGVRLKGLPVEGVQFHPESILSPEGSRLLSNFLAMKSPNRG